MIKSHRNLKLNFYQILQKCLLSHENFCQISQKFSSNLTEIFIKSHRHFCQISKKIFSNLTEISIKSCINFYPTHRKFCQDSQKFLWRNLAEQFYQISQIWLSNFTENVSKCHRTSVKCRKNVCQISQKFSSTFFTLLPPNFFFSIFSSNFLPPQPQLRRQTTLRAALNYSSPLTLKKILHTNVTPTGGPIYTRNRKTCPSTLLMTKRHMRSLLARTDSFFCLESRMPGARCPRFTPNPKKVAELGSHR